MPDRRSVRPSRPERQSSVIRCTRDSPAISRRIASEVCLTFPPPPFRGCRGRPGACRTRGPACCLRFGKKMHASIQVRRELPGLPCAMALRLISCSSRRTAVLPPSPALLIADLAPAPRRQNHTPSPYAPGMSVHHAVGVHRIPPRVRDDGQRPSSCSETSGVMPLICARTKAEYFSIAGLTRFRIIRIDGTGTT